MRPPYDTSADAGTHVLATIPEKQITPLAMPVNIAQSDVDMFTKAGTYTFPSCHVTEFNNVLMIEHSLSYTLKLQKLRKYTRMNHKKPEWKDWLRPVRDSVVGTWSYVPKCLWISDLYSGNIFHWLTDALTRLLWLTDHGYSAPVLVRTGDTKINPFIEHTLLHLGHQIQHYHNVFIGQLFTTSFPISINMIDGKSVNRIRQHFVSKSTGMRRVYISRRNAKIRQFINEREVCRVVSQHGYEIHCFEDYDAPTQIAIMSQTNRLVGAHGAGLSNMLFMPPRGKVLEINCRVNANLPCYFRMATELHHTYSYLLSNPNSGGTDHTYVDIDNLHKCLTQMDSE